MLKCSSVSVCHSGSGHILRLCGCAAVLSEGILSAGWTWQMHSARRPSQLKLCGRIQTWVLNQHRATLPVLRRLIREIKICVEVVLQLSPLFSSLLSHLQQGHYTLWTFHDLRCHDNRLERLFEIILHWFVVSIARLLQVFLYWYWYLGSPL